MKKMITIFTPTYNREKLLKRCYESLKKQTDKKFEWLVVDDGSTDDTRKLIDELSEKANFEIRYFYQENGGKHRAFNLAVKECKTNFFLLLDSDDMLTEDAIEVLNEKCKLISDNRKICGIIGNRGNMNNAAPIGIKIPNVEVASGLELYQKNGFKGDTLRIYKKSILERFPFPEIEGENFMSENVVFDKIDQKYKMLVIHEVLYLCEYQENGLSKNINKMNFKNPIGHAFSLRSAAETALTMKKKIGVTALYILWTKKFHIRNSYKNYGNKIIYLVCLPVGLVFWVLRVPKFYFNAFKEVKDE